MTNVCRKTNHGCRGNLRLCVDSCSDNRATTEGVLERTSNTAVYQDTYGDGDNHTEEDEEEDRETNSQTCSWVCVCVGGRNGGNLPYPDSESRLLLLI